MNVLKNINPRKTYFSNVCSWFIFYRYSIEHKSCFAYKYKKNQKKKQKFYFMHPCDEKKIYIRIIFKN